MERIDIYDQWGGVEQKGVEKDVAHREGLLHHAVCTWILNDREELLLQRRSEEKPFAPGMWDNSFSGHVDTGESLLSAVLREGEEELGIRLKKEKLWYLFTCPYRGSIPGSAYEENELYDIFLYRDDVEIGDISFPDGEVAEVRYVHYKEVERMWKAGDGNLIVAPEHFTLLFYILHRMLEREDGAK
ncbi:NUDIX domain-containing protein [Eubacteriales bacterium OttesenSCG-928-M02]|nr:NUDIX domain-containing protein [Eubacteriales bacterium OttesenSCG-928-M02]